MTQNNSESLNDYSNQRTELPHNFLYRGISAILHEKNQGRLIPKSVESFSYTFQYGEDKYGSGAAYGHSTRNAVIRHQLRQEGFPTSGVSTTPMFEQAKSYALYESERGYIYKIDRTRLAAHGVKEYVVSEYAKQPSAPKDEEVILVAADNGILPDTVVVETIAVCREH